MKKAIAVVAVMLAASTPLALASSCKKKTSGNFGEFSYNGNYLTEYAESKITASEARSIINNSNTAYAKTGTCYAASVETYNIFENIANAPQTPDSVYDKITMGYGAVNITTQYYTSEFEDMQTKTDYITGRDFVNIVKTNKCEPFGQLVAKNLIAFDELIDFMEQHNEAFKQSEIYKIAPFDSIFTYHKGATGNLIVQTRDFAELASSVGGGIGCSYRQDTEIVYDAELKVSTWQTSLGVYSATPKGTVKQGYILKVDFEWQKKG